MMVASRSTASKPFAARCDFTNREDTSTASSETGEVGSFAAPGARSGGQKNTVASSPTVNPHSPQRSSVELIHASFSKAGSATVVFSSQKMDRAAKGLMATPSLTAWTSMVS